MPRARQTDASKLSDFRAPRFIRSQPSPSRTTRPRRGPESPGGSTARRSADRAGRSGSCKSRAVKDRVARQPFPDIYRDTDDGAVVSFNASARGSQLHRQAAVAVHWRDTRVEPPHVDRHHAARFHCLRVLQAAQDEAVPHALLGHFKLLVPSRRDRGGLMLPRSRASATLARGCSPRPGMAVRPPTRVLDAGGCSSLRKVCQYVCR